MNIWHLVAFLMGYALGKDQAELGSMLLGVLLGLVVLKLLGWAFGLFVTTTDAANDFLQKPNMKKFTSCISYLIAFVFTHWMLIFISLVLALPIAFILESFLSGVDKGIIMMLSAGVLFPVVELLYHIQIRKKKRQIFGFDV